MIIIRQETRFASRRAFKPPQLTEMSEHNGLFLTEMSELWTEIWPGCPNPADETGQDVRALPVPDVRAYGAGSTQMSERYGRPIGGNWPRCPNKKAISGALAFGQQGQLSVTGMRYRCPPERNFPILPSKSTQMSEPGSPRCPNRVRAGDAGFSVGTQKEQMHGHLGQEGLEHRRTSSDISVPSRGMGRWDVDNLGHLGQPGSVAPLFPVHSRQDGEQPVAMSGCSANRPATI